MITQYPWASVKKQERKHIEIGFMITLLVAIISFYSVPQFNDSVTFEEPFVLPPVEVVSIPVTVQPPEKVIPKTPSLPVESENEDMDLDLPVELSFDPIDFDKLVPPDTPVPRGGYLDSWMVSDKPEPIGGYNAIMRKVIYPEIAREAGIEGTVTIEALIGRRGLVEDARVISGIPNTGLDQAALDAILQTTFSPALQMGKPVPVRIAIPIKFRLK